METIATSLSEAIEELAEIVSTSEDGTEISGDPSTIMATSNKEAKVAYKEYLNFKQEHSKEMREIKKIQVELGSNKKEIVEVRREVSRGSFFHTNNAIRLSHLNEDANLVDMKSWIIDFRNYIIFGYNGEVPKRGHYTQMRPILDRSWANEKDLET